MTSIRHFPATYPLPDWRNFGVMLRVLLGINGLAALAALVQAPTPADWVGRFVDLAAVVEPLLLVGLGLLSLGRDLLRKLPVRLGQAVVLALAGTLAAAMFIYARSLDLVEPGAVLRAVLLAMAATAVMLAYFDLRARAFSPAQAEARLAALNARIRPHFLFNSLNAVLSLIRARPQQAEEALEALSDLFRAAMRDPGAMVSLADEIDLCRQYLALEALRLGERLAVDWKIGPVLMSLPIPPLMLQPLLENAVYHGIEPSPEGGVVRIAIAQKGDELRIAITNPTTGQAQPAPGNQMALANIYEPDDGEPASRQGRHDALPALLLLDEHGERRRRLLLELHLAHRADRSPRLQSDHEREPALHLPEALRHLHHGRRAHQGRLRGGVADEHGAGVRQLRGESDRRLQPGQHVAGGGRRDAGRRHRLLHGRRREVHARGGLPAGPRR